MRNPQYRIYSVSNLVEAPKSRLMSTYFDLENEYNAVLSTRYAEKQPFCSLSWAVNKVRDTIDFFGGAAVSGSQNLPSPRLRRGEYRWTRMQVCSSRVQ